MPPLLSQLHLTTAQLPQLQQQPPAPTTHPHLLKALTTPLLLLKAPTTLPHLLRLKAHITHLPQHQVLMEQQPQPQHQHLALTTHLLLPQVPTTPQPQPQPKALMELQPLLPLPQLHQSPTTHLLLLKAPTTHLLLLKAPTILLPLPRTPIQQQLLSRN